MHRISRRAALAALAIPFAAAGRPAKAAETLRVGKAVSENPGYIPLDIGMKYGFFAKEGVAIEKLDFTGGAKVAQAIAAGALEIGLSSGPDMAFTAKGAPQLAVASISASPAFMGIIVGGRSTVRSADGLKGKKIGVTTAGSLTYWLIEELNRVKGWSGAERAMPTVIGGAPTAMMAGLRSGTIDAGIGALQIGWELEDQHAGRVLMPISDYVSALEIFVTFASTKLMQQNPDALRRFLKGWCETVAFMKSHKDEATKMMIEVIGYPPDIAQRTYDTLMDKYSTTGRFEQAALQKLFASFVDLKVLKPTDDISKLYTEQFLPA